MTATTPKLGTTRYIAGGGNYRPQERYGEDGWKKFCCDFCGDMPEEKAPFETCPKCGADYTVRLMVGPEKAMEVAR
jgi:hypothetical protein